MTDKICGASCTNTCVLAVGHDGWCSYDTPYVTIRELRAALTAALEQNERFATELAKLRTLIDKHNDECRECPVIEA